MTLILQEDAVTCKCLAFELIHKKYAILTVCLNKEFQEVSYTQIVF